MIFVNLFRHVEILLSRKFGVCMANDWTSGAAQQNNAMLSTAIRVVLAALCGAYANVNMGKT